MSALVVVALQLQPVEQRHAVGDRDEFQVAAAFGLEGLLDLRAGTPFGGEALICIDGQGFSCGGRRREADGQHDCRTKGR